MTTKKDIIPIEKDRVYFLFKRGQKEHIQALLEEGEVYINSVDYIRDCDDNKERSDEDDGIMEREYLGDIEVTVCDVGGDFDKDGITFNGVRGIVKTDHQQKGNIYCLTGIFSEHLTADIPPHFNTKSFGETTILIHSPAKFLERLFRALKEKGLEGVKAAKVAYYKDDYSGDIGFFKKHENFMSQSEFRIFVPNTKNEPIKLKIGSLKDIASINIGFIKLKYTDKTEHIIAL